MGGTEDGDFIALRQRREAKKNEIKKKDEILEFHAAKKNAGHKKSVDFVDNNNKGPRTEVLEQWNNIRESIESDDVGKLEICRIKLGDYLFSEPELVDQGEEFDLKQNALHVALNGQHFKTAEVLIKLGDEALILDKFEVSVKTIVTSKTSLHILTEFGNNTLIKLMLLQIKSNETLVNFLNDTVLTVMEGQRPRYLSSIHIAASLGNTELVEFLVASGVSPSYNNSKNDTPILWASRFNHKETARCLLKLGADINMENDKGSTALYWAVRYGYPDMVKLLTAEGKANVHQRRKLGLVCPLVLAAAFGYTEIVSILIEYGAKVNTRINGGITALHYAAIENNPESIIVLLDKGADIEAVDEMGNTALILATKENHLESIDALISHGASIEAKNRSGIMVWDYAIESEDIRLLTALVNVYKEMKGGSEPYMFIGVNTPLHIAARKGDCEKISCLLNLGLDSSSTDTDGNTFMHLASKENKYKVLEKFLQNTTMSKKNGMGDQPLHMACRAGNLEAVKSIVFHCDLNSVNNMGETVLHVASKSAHASDELLTFLIDVMVKTHHWSLVDSQDLNGNTALHSAAQVFLQYNGRHQIIRQLALLNPTIENKDGDNPLHLAANRENWRTLEVMLDVFNNTGKGFNIDHPTREGKTLLHICAWNGDYQRVDHLIDLGADLASVTWEKHTILHEIVKRSMIESHRIETFIKVYFTIVEKAARWWCISHELTYPDQESDLYRTYRRLSVQYLTGELTNYNNLSVIGYATSIGALPMMRVILHTSNIYVFDKSNVLMYDVTNMTPKAIGLGIAASGKKKSLEIARQSRVGVALELDEVDFPDIRITMKSILEILVGMDDEKIATEILDMAPIRQLVQNYWSSYQWLFFVLMSIHIIYMILFSFYYLPYTSVIYKNETAIIEPMTGVTSHAANYILLLWPISLLMYEFYNIGMVIYKKFIKAEDRLRILMSCLRINKVPHLVYANMTHVVTIAFAILVVMFVVETERGNRITSLYFLAASMFIGWLFSIVYTRGFETVHSLSTMLQHIIINDVTRFLFIYVFVLTGFGFALHSLFHLTTSQAEQFPTAWHSLFFTFNLLVGMADHDFDQQFDTSYYYSGSRSIWVKLVYILYMIMATVILLNLLIAMLSDTYSGVAESESSSWRVGSLKLALQIENSMPFIPAFFKWIGLTRERIVYNADLDRYVLYSSKRSLSSHKIGSSRKEVVDLLSTMENRINNISNTQEDLTRKLDSVIQILNMETTTTGQAAKLWLGSRNTNKNELNVMLDEVRPSSRMK